MNENTHTREIYMCIYVCVYRNVGPLCVGSRGVGDFGVDDTLNTFRRGTQQLNILLNHLLNLKRIRTCFQVESVRNTLSVLFFLSQLRHLLVCRPFTWETMQQNVDKKYTFLRVYIPRSSHSRSE